MPLIPGWTLLTSGCAPVVLIGGWAFAGTLQPSTYDPMAASISALAAQDAAYPWVMTGALYVVGICYLVTAVGLRAVPGAGRVALFCGGLASIAVALSPEPGGGATSLQHMLSSGLGFTALALFPMLAAVRGYGINWALRPVTGYAVTFLMAAGAAWFLFELHGHAGNAGLIERLLTGAQAIWPVVFVTACLVSRPGRAPSAVAVLASTSPGERSDVNR